MRRGVEVGAAARADVEGAARQRAEALFDERGLAVDQARELGAVLERAAGDRVDVVLVGLAEVAGVGAGDGALVAHPRDGDGGVQAPREGDADALADGEGLENLRHASSLLSGADRPPLGRQSRAYGSRPGIRPCGVRRASAPAPELRRASRAAASRGSGRWR